MTRTRLLPVLLLLVHSACAEDPFVPDGPPALEIGTGEFAFEAVTDGQKLPIVHGPQGGDHVWLGIRVVNMNPKRLHLDATMVDAEDGEPVGFDLFFDVDLFRGPSGDMESAGLPLQLNPDELGGITIRATVVATDRDDRMISDTMEIVPQ